ncbi:MAG: hypothetical protein GX383_04835 [Clostridium sp.]|jgi:hypothetical protein|nr:hypothetical protein [Clostridium sp.]
MILYSIVPPEVVFKDFFEWADQNNLELNYLGEKVVVVPLSNNRYRIERVISTSPKAYLNPKLMPGSIILGNELSFR